MGESDGQWAKQADTGSRSLERTGEDVPRLGGRYGRSMGVFMSSEAAVQAAVRLEAMRRGILLWRNNSGVLVDADGRPVRFGLGNDSKQCNAVMKSIDLIGIGPGGTFWALECKRPGWHLTPGDQRGQAQQAFINLIKARGGVAAFVTGVEDIP